jgi:nicotinate phosphoribosyltransferase
MEVTGVRLDSGDLVELSQKVRSLLPDINIFASGDLDEWEVNRLREAGASIDGYGIGTKLVTGSPVNGVYKLVEIDGIPSMKESSGKVTYPGRKQIFRTLVNSKIRQDRLGLAEEKPQNGEQPLLELVMKEGQRMQTPQSLETIRQRTAASIASLAAVTRQIDKPTPVTVKISDTLESLRILIEEKNRSFQ